MNIDDFRVVCMNNIDSILEYYDVDITDSFRHGPYLRLRCPLHGGKSLNFSFDLEKGLYLCFSRHCEEQYGPNIIDFVIAFKQCSYGDAMDDLRRITRVSSVDNTHVKKDRALIKSMERDTAELKVINESMLSQIKYMAGLEKERGFATETIRHFGIGVCTNYKSHLKNRWVFPIRNINGGLVGATARALYSNMKPKWMHTKGMLTQKLLYNLHEAKDEVARRFGQIILCEGVYDVIRFWEAGYKNAVAVFGAHLSMSQIDLIAEASAFDVAIAFDNDEAGIKEAKKAVKLIYNKTRKGTRIINLPKQYNDVGQMTVKEIKEYLGEQLT